MSAETISLENVILNIFPFKKVVYFSVDKKDFKWNKENFGENLIIIIKFKDSLISYDIITKNDNGVIRIVHEEPTRSEVPLFNELM